MREMIKAYSAVFNIKGLTSCSEEQVRVVQNSKARGHMLCFRLHDENCTEIGS